MGTHAKFAPSAAERWMACNAAPHREFDLPDTTSDAADRGTCYHAVAEIMLRRLTTPALAAGNVAKVEVRRAFRFAYDTVHTYGDTKNGVDAETARRLMNEDEAHHHAVTYVLWILETFGKKIANGARFGLEDRVHISPNCGGTVDFWCQHGTNLDVVDLKTGRHPISPVENKQGLTYAAGLYERLRDVTQRVTLTIFQDGMAHQWDTDTARVAEWSHEVSERTISLKSDATPGVHCKWCKAKPTCEEYAAHNLALVQDEFTPTVVEDVAGTIANIDGETAARLLDAYTQIEAFVAAALPVLTERVYREGLEVPGYKTIRGTKHKAWNDKDEAVKKLGPKATKPQVLTPNQAIKALGEDSCAGLWFQPVGEVKLVPEGTRGKPVTASAQIEFAD